MTELPDTVRDHPWQVTSDSGYNKSSESKTYCVVSVTGFVYHAICQILMFAAWICWLLCKALHLQWIYRFYWKALDNLNDSMSHSDKWWQTNRAIERAKANFPFSWKCKDGLEVLNTCLTIRCLLRTGCAFSLQFSTSIGERLIENVINKVKIN